MDSVLLLSVTPVTEMAEGAGSKSSSLLHDQKLVDNKTAVTNSVTCLSRLFFICIVFLS